MSRAVLVRNVVAKVSSQTIEAFFGDGANDQPGVIVLQSDPIETVFADLVQDLLDYASARMSEPALKELKVPRLTEKEKRILVNLTIKPLTRFYKARTWINKWDTEGAQAIREEFQKRKTPPPRLVLSDHQSPDEIESAPFQISMGLGYTDLIQQIMEDEEVFGPWMRRSWGETSGDTVSFIRKLMPEGDFTAFAHEEAEDPTFFRLLPRSWTPQYVPRWLRMVNEPKKASDVHDYAIILRHTRSRGKRRKVRFVLAGFTERGTAAAGFYLASKWPELYGNIVKRQLDEHPKSLGDFLVVIGGVPRPERFDEWAEDPKFPPVTPSILSGLGIDSEWVQRLREK
jgi:hypothetical protein